MASDMETATIKATVREVIKSTFQVDDSVPPNLLQKGFLPNWDSLGHMSLVTAIENTFGVSFPTYMLQDLVSVDSIVSAVQELRS
jgi:acyl carrier protein